MYRYRVYSLTETIAVFMYESQAIDYVEFLSTTNEVLYGWEEILTEDIHEYM